MTRRTSYSTVGRIAQRLNEPIHRVEYVIRTRNIQPEALGWKLPRVLQGCRIPHRS